MNRLSKTFLALSGAAAIALVIMVASPRTVRAVTAILVQMTNTTANPGVTQDITTTNAQIVELHCVNTTPFCYQVLPDGSISTTGFFVPPGNALVITSVDILPNPPGAISPIRANLVVAPHLRETWVIQTNTSTLLQFPTAGIVVGSLQYLYMTFVQTNGAATGLDNYTANMHGYLTSN